MPKVSVIIPTYNRGYIVGEAIESVLSQTFDDFEIMVVDDGSTDNTRNVVNFINDNRIKYFYKNNGGVSSARNMGLDKAAGEYIAFLDSDDLWPENYLQTMVTHLQTKPEYGAAYCATTLQKPDGQIIKYDNFGRCKSGQITRYLFKNSVIWPSVAVLRKEAVNSMFFDELLTNAEDSDFFLRVSVQTKFLFVPDIKVTRRLSPDNLYGICGATCNRILVLERFYFRLGGRKKIPWHAARVKLSHAYRQTARKYRVEKHRKAVIPLYRKAIRYWPFDLRLYIDMAKTLAIRKFDDKMPDWQMPEPMSMPKTSFQHIDDKNS
jgi:glycosyltransferase involved in cell wall biosynthesis